MGGGGLWNISQNRSHSLSFAESPGDDGAPRRPGTVWHVTKNICSFDLYTIALAIGCMKSTLHKTAERRAPLRPPGRLTTPVRGGAVHHQGEEEARRTVSICAAAAPGEQAGTSFPVWWFKKQG